MFLSRTVQRAALTAVIVSASALTVPASAQAAELPPACQTALLETLDKFPVVDFTVPEKVQNTVLVEVLNLSEADQAAFTEPACAAWNSWATANGQAVAGDLDTRYRSAAGPVCNKFARSALATIKKYAPDIPAGTRELEKVAKKVWGTSMQKLADQATNADCQRTYTAVKAGW
ncbi:MAG TPA: hypothetical protein VN520_06605 [Streptomyces sp.]|uniref:hypothetical protein n=1 Tax=Streptomyces sp. TaxID=1931 RepID=UPI002B9B6FB5|nr:hypothetical protein [Streptomyces sp.]HWU06051.1 hypothetical protein [Streptomyces sp.]